MLDVKVAQLSPADLQAIRDLEQSLGDRVCLLAIEKEGALYVLEAKMAPNRWQRIDQVYPEIEDLRVFYRRHEDAHHAKAALKSFLNSAKANSLQKRPIRIRLSVPVIDD
ncbi:MAG: hypothetical protein PVJ53_00610 [Desulfobacterales bacterium]|jgi:hypothetical protein